MPLSTVWVKSGAQTVMMRQMDSASNATVVTSYQADFRPGS